MLTRGEILSLLTAHPGSGGSWDILIGLLSERFSCRAYRPDPVPKDTLEAIFNAAQLTSSWCNAQPWQISVTTGEGTEKFRSALYQHAAANLKVTQPDFPFPERYEGSYRDRRVAAGVALYQSLAIPKGDSVGAREQMLENYRFFGAPHVLVLTSEADLGVYGAIDCGIYLGNLMLLMQSRGIDSIAQGALAKFSPFVKQYLGIPDNRRIVCGLSFGFADHDHPVNGFRTTRAVPSSAVQWIGE